MATAHLLPDLRLEVEGPGRHGLIDGWVRVLENTGGVPVPVLKHKSSAPYPAGLDAAEADGLFIPGEA